ncbi:MAG: putative toxin-antitoxin system toxin component, PIN family [Candidatus Marinimicrobia bacterium]|nr:putative toxin-antitoxin system toxin component, PIN family [Candidatus Neomarinimicrobiota bacterium]
MRLVLDTNVFISGVFFSGPPYQVLEAWRDGRFELVISDEILTEYRRVSDTLAAQFPGVDLAPILDLVAREADLIQAPNLSEQVCVDPDDDKFLACALAGNTGIIVSGDRHLLQVKGYRGIEVCRPREFVDLYLKDNL